MAPTLCRLTLAGLLALSFVISARAQSRQAWPELSTFVKLNDQMRFYFLATTTKENRNSTDGEFGPNFDFYLKPLRNQKRWGLLPLDESKNRVLMIRVGYRYLPSYAGDNPAEHRGIVEATPRYPLTLGVLGSAPSGYPGYRRRVLLALPQPVDRRKGIRCWPLPVWPLWARGNLL